MSEEIQAQSVWLLHIFLILLFYGLLFSRYHDGEVSRQQRDYHVDSWGAQNDIIGEWGEVQIPLLQAFLTYPACSVSNLC